jgi:hypothetical protein
MRPPKQAPASSADLSDTVAKLFDCEVTSATAGLVHGRVPGNQTALERRRGKRNWPEIRKGR